MCTHDLAIAIIFSCAFSVCTGNIVFQWFMKMSKSCRTPAEYNRYHAELSVFLKMPTTQKALGQECIAAMFKLKLTLREKEHKLAGYVRHGIKSNMGAMTTSPTEGQNKQICHGDDHCSVRHDANTALRRLIFRIQ